MNVQNTIIKDLPLMLIMPFVEHTHPQFDQTVVFHQSVAKEFNGDLNLKSLGQSSPVVVVLMDHLGESEVARLLKVMTDTEMPFTLSRTDPDSKLTSGWIYREGWDTPIHAVSSDLSGLPSEANFGFEDIAVAGQGLMAKVPGSKRLH